MRPPTSSARLNRQRHSDYLYWARTQSQARFNLATSGVSPFPLSEIPFAGEPPGYDSDDPYGYAPLQEAIAKKCGVDLDCVVATTGASMSNHLAMAALVDPGDEVLIEQPAFELLVSTALYLGAAVKRFARTEESGYAVDSEEIRRAISPKTKLIVLTNLHNPSSARTPESVLREVGDLARGVGAHVLVDEVYLDAVYHETPRTAFQLGPEFIVTNSLTKVYGLSSLRCGWILAPHDLARAIWRLSDLFGTIPARPAEALSVAAFEHLDVIRERARRVVEADRGLLNEFLAGHAAVSAPRTGFGTTAFMRLRDGDADRFLMRLRADHETSVVPGRFFGMADHFRVGMGVKTEMFREGIRRVGLACATKA
jgi:aspartate/methionine/tyrosine aminotransferase